MPVSDEHRELIAASVNASRDDHKAVVREAVAEELEHRRRIPEDMHLEHHEFTSMLIERERERAHCRKRRSALIDRVVEQAAGWSVILLLAGIGTAVWHYVTHTIRGQ